MEHYMSSCNSNSNKEVITMTEQYVLSQWGTLNGLP